MSRLRWRVVVTCEVTALVVLVVFLVFVHPFLALNGPVAADVLVVEGWVPHYVLDRAAAEIATGGYARVFVSGLTAKDGSSDAAWAVDYLLTKGVDGARVTAAPAAEAHWNRTSRMAAAIRDRLRAMGFQPRGVNVLTLGPHGRQSRLAFRRMLGPAVPVGVITVPKDDYDPEWWWLSAAGIKKTTKDFAGWMRELVFGLRS